MPPERVNYRYHFTLGENIFTAAFIGVLLAGSLYFANKNDDPGNEPIPEGPIVQGAPALVLDREKRPDPRYPEESGIMMSVLLLKQCTVVERSKDPKKPDRMTYDPKPKKDDTEGCEEAWTVVSDKTYKDKKVSGRGKILVLFPE